MLVNTTDFKDKVVIVTGAGRGLGRSHAIEFARRGASVVVNDLGGAVDGTGASNTAQSVVDEILAMGGKAVASTASVAIEEQARSIVADAEKHFGTVDIVVNNAGILRDKTFANVTMDNFRAVLDVHLMGSVHVTSAAWPIMVKKGWGRVVFTSSASGLSGNFGQSNYAAAKMGLVGLMNVLKLEGIRKGIRVNCIAPGMTITRMTESLPGANRSTPESISPGVLYLASERAPNGVILAASQGQFTVMKLASGETVDLGEEATYEALMDSADDLLSQTPVADFH